VIVVDKWSKVILTSVIVIFFLLSQWIIFSVDREHWFDVSFTLETVHKLRQDGIVSIDFQKWDVHPPVFYYLSYFWSFLNPGAGEYHWAQELPAVLMLGFLIFVFFALRKLFGRSGELAVIGLSMCTTYLHYGTEVRTYALLLLLSGIVFYGVVNDLKGWCGVAAMVAVFLMPLCHYFASMGVFFYAAVGMLYARKRSEFFFDAKKRYVIFIVIGLIGIAIAGFGYALSQKERVAGTWFEPPSVLEWPSSVVYAFFVSDKFVLVGVSQMLLTLLYLFFLGLLGYCSWKTYSILKSGVPSIREMMLILMGSSALVPVIGLAAIPLLGGSFANLYHYRFFLIVTWLFAAMFFVLIADIVVQWFGQEGKGLRSVLLSVGVVLILLTMAFGYGRSVHHELGNLMKQTPCPKGNESVIQIAHESPFSALPYEVYAREYKCKWFNFVSTRLTPMMLNGGGGDAMAGRIFFNKTLPDGDYYYVQAEKTVKVDGYQELIAVEDGVNLTFVRRNRVGDG